MQVKKDNLTIVQANEKKITIWRGTDCIRRITVSKQLNAKELYDILAFYQAAECL